MERKSNLGARLIKWLGTSFAVYLAAELVTGIEVSSFWTAVWVGLLLGLLNTVVKPLLTVISIPLILVTFGLFLVVINAVLLMFCDELVEGFVIDGFWPAVWGAVIISFVSMILEPKSPKNNDDQNGDGNNSGNRRGGFQIKIERRG